MSGRTSIYVVYSGQKKLQNLSKSPEKYNNRIQKGLGWWAGHSIAEGSLYTMAICLLLRKNRHMFLIHDKKLGGTEIWKRNSF